MVFTTYLDGSGMVVPGGIALDSTGRAVVCGETAGAFPTTAGAYDSTLGGTSDAFVAKLNATGTGLIYSTYLGGSTADGATGVALDSTGAAIVCGDTDGAFPATVGAYDTSGGAGDTFITKLNLTGGGLTYSTYLGGSAVDHVYGIGVDSSDAAIVCGATGGSFPTTSGSYQPAAGGATDAFVTKLKTINTAATSLAVADVTGQAGEQLNLTATLTSGGTGVRGATLTFTMPGGATIDRTTNADGIADYYWDVPVGQANATIGAAFAGDSMRVASSGSGSLTVTVASKVTVLPATGTAGSTVGIAAYLWDGKFMSGLTGKQLTLKIDGGAASNFPALTAGAHTTTVDRAGGGGYPASQGAGTLTANALARSYIRVHNHGATQNAATRLTCYLYDYRRNGDLIPVAGKSITFSVGGTTVGTATTASDGKAFGAYTPASTGALAQSMSFAGDAAYAAATGTGTLTVAP